MNRWLLIRRLRWPAFLILFGITALLNQWGVLSFGRSWPLYLILAGALSLLERAVLAGEPPPQFPGQSFAQPQPYGSPGSLHAQLPDSSVSPFGAGGSGNSGIRSGGVEQQPHGRNGGV